MTNNTEIGIIGYGVVGKAVDYTLSRSYSIIKYDKYVNIDHFSELSKCEFVFITVPTPFDYSQKNVDDSAVIESLDKLSSIGYGGIVIIKSTILPGSTDKYSEKYPLKLVFNPEFLRESTTPNEDFSNQNCVVVGTPVSKIFEEIKSMYEAVLAEDTNFHHLSFKEAEMVKYSQNTMLASRVALANLIYDACTSLGLDYNLIKSLAFDNFEIIGPHMTEVPGPDSRRGFGGKCLPKDILGFSTIADSPLIREIIKYNEQLRDDLHLVIENYK